MTFVFIRYACNLREMAFKIQCGECLTEFDIPEELPTTPSPGTNSLGSFFGLEFSQYTIPLVLLSDCHHGFCIECIMNIKDSTESARIPSIFDRSEVPSTIRCPTCQICSKHYSICTINENRKYLINFNIQKQFKNFKDYVEILYNRCTISNSAPGPVTSEPETSAAEPAAEPAAGPEPDRPDPIEPEAFDEHEIMSTDDEPNVKKMRLI